MSNLKFWILLLALAAFGGGLGVGWFAANRVKDREARAQNLGPFTGFQSEFVRTFKISPERARLLGEMLACYQRDIDQLEQDQLESGRGELEGKLQKLALTYRERIRNSVLPEGQRSEYDRLAAGIDWKTSN